MAKKKKKLGKELPPHFLERLTDIVGPSLFAEMKRTFVQRPTTFRVNTLKTQTHENTKNTKTTLIEQGFKLKPVAWYRDAFVLDNKSKRELTETDEYKEGKIYIQSLASMIPPLVLDPRPGEKVLDLTAAPGSKTSQMAALMNRQGELVANDVNKVRFARLEANMRMLGVDSISPSYEGESPTEASGEGVDWKFELRLADGSALCQEYGAPYFDKILVDAICSAEARFIDGDPRTYGYWSPHKIKQMAYRQQKLLMAAWTVLKPGGTLVYSTCTIAPEENESRVSKMLERHPDAEVMEIQIPGLKRLPPVKEWKGKVFHQEVAKCLRIFPTKEVEGFFIAKIRKDIYAN